MHRVYCFRTIKTISGGVRSTEKNIDFVGQTHYLNDLSIRFGRAVK